MFPLFPDQASKKAAFLSRLKDGVVLGALLETKYIRNREHHAHQEMGPPLGAGTICVLYRILNKNGYHVKDLAPTLRPKAEFPVIELPLGAYDLQLRYDPARILVDCLPHIQDGALDVEHLQQISSYHYKIGRHLNEQTKVIKLQLCKNKETHKLSLRAQIGG